MVTDIKSLLIVAYIVSSFGRVLVFINDSVALKISSSNWSKALFRFIDSDFQKNSCGYATTGAINWFSFVKLVFSSTSKQAYNALLYHITGIKSEIKR